MRGLSAGYMKSALQDSSNPVAPGSYLLVFAEAVPHLGMPASSSFTWWTLPYADNTAQQLLPLSNHP